jgi:ATP-dependent Clp protease ATP-binding subunit ClpA
VFETFTEPARAAIESAEREARGMGHGEVQVEHLLLGLFSLGADDTVSHVCADFALTIDAVRATVRERLGVGSCSPEDQLRFSRDAKDRLTLAYRLGMGGPTTTDMLLALLARGEGGASEVLRALGADPNAMRAEVKKRAATLPEQRATGQLHITSHPGALELDFGD